MIKQQQAEADYTFEMRHQCLYHHTTTRDRFQSFCRPSKNIGVQNFGLMQMTQQFALCIVAQQDEREGVNEMKRIRAAFMQLRE